MSERLRLRCGQCGHTWDSVEVPMPMTEMADKMKRVTCPKCVASSDNIFLAPDEGEN